MCPLRSAGPRNADTRRVIVEPRLRPRRLAEAVPARLGVRAWLGCLMLGSFLVRGLVAGSVRTPSYFPDEYIYTSLSRSLATAGRPLVRGEPAHFPALLEPLLAAPLWLVGSTATAYRLVQFENALFMSSRGPYRSTCSAHGGSGSGSSRYAHSRAPRSRSRSPT